MTAGLVPRLLHVRSPGLVEPGGPWHHLALSLMRLVRVNSGVKTARLRRVDQSRAILDIVCVS